MLKQFAKTFTHFVSSRKGAWTVLIGWIVIILVLSLAAPGSKPYAVNSGEGSVHNDTPSAAAQQIMDEQFPSKDGLTALLVFHDPHKISIKRGVTLTGGVISSAGIILAATFCVLITQPLQELFLFGILMAMGILIDTFLVRGMLLPAILSMLGGSMSNTNYKNNLPIYPE